MKAKPEQTQVHPIVLFDGVCNFCNGSVNFLIDHDPLQRLRFASLQSEAGQSLLKQYNLPTADFDSMVVIDQGKVYLRSSAALRISKYLPGIWSWGQVFIVIPSFIRNAAYNLIAKNRYRWFGQSEQCRMPKPEDKARFLNDPVSLPGPT